METVNKENKQCYILGDLNLDGLKVNLNEHVKKCFDTILENNFVPVITKPTRIFNNSVSLDHILINTKTIQDKVSITTGNIYSGVPIFISTKIKGKSKEERPIIRIFGEKMPVNSQKLSKSVIGVIFMNPKMWTKHWTYYIKIGQMHMKNLSLKRDYLFKKVKKING